MASKVFVSPGVYTSEKDLTFVTRQIGVTTLGLVGETTIGPAFQPIFISNYDEFLSFFGGLNATKVKDTGFPQYELPYIAKSFLSQTNQLYVTRVLGLSGYNAGLSWGITLDANIDSDTITQTGSASTANLISYTATSAETIVSLVSSDPIIQTLIDENQITLDLASLATLETGDTLSVSVSFIKNGSEFSGASFDLTVTNKGTSGSFITGETSGDTIYYSGTSYTDVENKLVALLRSRGRYNTDEVINFEVSAVTDVAFGTNIVDAETNALGSFSLTGTSSIQGSFNYELSFDRTKRNYIGRVLGRSAQDGKTALFSEEIYQNIFDYYNNQDKIRGVKLSLVNYSDQFSEYKQQCSNAVTPYIVSEVRGNKVLRLFRLHTISDGNAANEQFKVSITNIRPDEREFDIQIRSFYDTDANPVILESFSRCTMDPTSNNYIKRKIGTLDGEYISKSIYVLVECDDSSDTSEAFPAGFVGYPVRDYNENGNTSVVTPDMLYKTIYDPFENKRKFYLGLSNTVGIDADFFDYKGIPMSSLSMWTGLTKGFHMDISASAVTIDNVKITIDSSGNTYSPTFEFETGCCEFKNETDLEGTEYEKLFSRKFTMAPYGGFDGWDIYRTRRTNTDRYIINGTRGAAGLLSGAFENRALSNGDLGTTSDYYAFLEAIWTFKNPEAVNINLFATPGIDTFDNTNLVESTIEMIEEDRADSLYIVTTPDTSNADGTVYTVEEVVDNLDGMFDSNYTATYWPWSQINDTENNVYIFVPPTRDVVRNIALTDNIAFPWFATAGIQRGNVDAIQARVKLTQQQRDVLYDSRINPITTFTSDGIKIWGNKTLQVKDSALNRINVRRLLLQARKLISAVSIRLLFEPNDSVVRNQFLALVNPILENIRSQRGLTDFRVVLSNDPEDIDRNQLTGQIFLKPTRSLEFIQIEFVLTNTGASFDAI